MNRLKKSIQVGGWKMSIENQLIIKVDGNSVDAGRIPVSVLEKVLRGAQQAIFILGEQQLSEGALMRERGPVPKKVKEEFTLELVDTSTGSFVMNLDLPTTTPKALQQKAFGTFHSIIDLLGDDKPKEIRKLIDNPQVLQRILKSIKEMLPKQDEYGLIIKGNQTTFTNRISTKEIKVVERLLGKPLEEARELIGKIVEIKIHGESYIGVFNGSRIIRCFTQDIESEVFQMIGKEVLLKGEAVLTNTNDIQELTTIDEVIVADPGKWFISNFQYVQKTYEMVDSFNVELDYIEGYWTITHVPLGLYISELTLREVIEACYLELSFLWEEYVLSDDSDLTKDAIELKKCIPRYIEKVVPSV